MDLQPIATQISKLRFFISLVAEQKPTSDANNFGIRPLPNLEAKFVAANTLLSLKKESNLFAASEFLDKIKKELSETNHKIFRAKNNQLKRKLRAKIENLRKKYSEELVAEEIIGPVASCCILGAKLRSIIFSCKSKIGFYICKFNYNFWIISVLAKNYYNAPAPSSVFGNFPHQVFDNLTPPMTMMR